MSWIPKKSGTGAPEVATAQQVAPAPASALRGHVHSLEMPVVMSVRRLPAPVYGTLMEIAPQGAKIRSLVLMERGTEVEFDLGIGSGAPLTIIGRVQSRSNASSGARFEYHLLFDGMASWQIDALARHVRELERRAAQARSIQRNIDKLPTTDRERRGSYRALSAFAVMYRPEGSNLNWTEGRVGDISSTGIRMHTKEKLAIGTAVDVRFTLPSSVLEVYPEETIAIDLSGNTPKRAGRPDLRRPFEEMALKARVVTKFAPVRDHEVFGVAFLEIDGFQREEIARFTHAIQLSKIRST